MGRIAPAERKKKYVPRLKPEMNFLYHFQPRDKNGNKVDLFCTFQKTLEDGRYLFENTEYKSNLTMSACRFSYLIRFALVGKTFIKAIEETLDNLDEIKGPTNSNVTSEQDCVEIENFILSSIKKLKEFTPDKAEYFEKTTGQSVIQTIVDMSNYLKSDRMKDSSDVPYFMSLLATV